MAVRASFASVPVLACLLAAGCVFAGEDDPGIDPATEERILTLIANFETLGGKDYQDNVEILGGVLRTHSVPYLVEGLSSSNTARVRGGCAMALGLSRDGRAMEPLREIMASDPDPKMRFTAAYNLCLFRDSRGLPVLMEALRFDADDGFCRAYASMHLKELTGLDFGYVPTDPPERREAAAARWEAWYKEAGPAGASMQLLRRPAGQP